MKKIAIITKCESCPSCIFDDQEIEGRWGKDWCNVLDKEVNGNAIPDECPLPTQGVPEYSIASEEALWENILFLLNGGEIDSAIEILREYLGEQTKTLSDQKIEEFRESVRKAVYDLLPHQINDNKDSATQIATDKALVIIMDTKL